LIAFMVLFKYRHHLNDRWIKGKLSFLYRGFKDDRYWWEFIIMIRKFLLIAILVFLGIVSQSLQAILISFVLTLSFYAHIKAHPYIVHLLHEMEEYSLVCLCFMSYAGLYFTTVTSIYGLDTTVLVLAILANCLFLLFWIYQYIKLLLSKKSPAIQRIVGFIRKYSKRKPSPEKSYAPPAKSPQFAPPSISPGVPPKGPEARLSDEELRKSSDDQIDVPILNHSDKFSQPEEYLSLQRKPKNPE